MDIKLVHSLAATSAHLEIVGVMVADSAGLCVASQGVSTYPEAAAAQAVAIADACVALHGAACDDGGRCSSVVIVIEGEDM